ncbi:hypothetical protein F5I97DRAFT_45191 [Phlebopus sp. FC_14]|nr:hypothetical protein F5I97DRAFT_45191 [Phlebopus sp. FC_14]
MSLPPFDDNRRAFLRGIASDTLSALQNGYFIRRGTRYDLSRQIQASERNTRYYSPDSSSVSNWQSASRSHHATPAEISILQISTLECARLLKNIHDNNPSDRGRIGVLNFASATKPGGGFINGAQAQEESIARASTLYPTLMTHTAQRFYDLHARDSKHGYYSHSMIYSPGVVIFRNDDGGWIQPYEVDVLTSAAVNAGDVRKSASGRFFSGVENQIEKEMTERMARLLFLFEKEGTRDIVLGSFGTGVFRNDVPVVAKIWADLLAVPGARFGKSFSRVMFAITGGQTFSAFETAFKARTQGGGGQAKVSRRNSSLM